MGYQIHTEIRVQASAEIIWNILMDFENFPQWNPFIKSIKGKTAVGERLDAHLGGMHFKPIVQSYEHNVHLSWKGQLWFPRVFDGTHRFDCVQNSDGSTTFIHSESFRGILVPLMKKQLRGKTTANFEAMNQALKQRAEASSK